MPSLVVVVVVVVVMPGQARQQNLANHSKEGNRLPKEGKDTTRPGIGFGKNTKTNDFAQDRTGDVLRVKQMP